MIYAWGKHVGFRLVLVQHQNKKTVKLYIFIFNYIQLNNKVNDNVVFATIMGIILMYWSL